MKLKLLRFSICYSKIDSIKIPAYANIIAKGIIEIIFIRITKIR